MGALPPLRTIYSLLFSPSYSAFSPVITIPILQTRCLAIRHIQRHSLLYFVAKDTILCGNSHRWHLRRSEINPAAPAEGSLHRVLAAATTPRPSPTPALPGQLQQHPLARNVGSRLLHGVREKVFKSTFTNHLKQQNYPELVKRTANVFRHLFLMVCTTQSQLKILLFMGTTCSFYGNRPALCWKTSCKRLWC